jgi:hypothetical protein
VKGTMNYRSHIHRSQIHSVESAIMTNATNAGIDIPN